MSALWDFQAVAVEEMRGHIRRGIKRILLVAPTGSGKGTMAAHMIHQASHRNKRIGFLVNRRELVKDLSRRLDGLGVEHGIIMADDPRVKPWLNVHVASIDSLHRRDIPAWDLVFLDEAHFSISPIWKSVTDRLGAAVLIGMTATPVRADGRGLEEMYDVMVRCPDTPALIEREFLVPPRVFAPPPPDLKGIKSTAGEYNQKELGTRMNTRVITGNILEHWLRHGRGRPTIGFGVTVEHSKAMTAQFCEAGIRAEHVDALTPDRDNGRGGNWRDGEDGIWVRLARYEIEVVFNVGIAGYGWDCLDSQTEILTGEGWRGMGQVKQCDLVYSRNRVTGQAELVPADSYGERPVRPGEKMIRVKNQRIDVRVTEGHHIVWSPVDQFDRRKSVINESCGRDLIGRKETMCLPLGVEAPYQESHLDLSDDEIKLIAWFMTDGCHAGAGISISQSKEYHHEIRDLLYRLGMKFRERCRPPRAAGYPTTLWSHEFNIGVRACGHLKKYFDKNVSPLLDAMDRRQFHLFWTELLKGDGEKSGPTKTGWLWCNLKTQADAYTRMAVLRGFSTSYSNRTCESGQVMWRISVRQNRWLALNANTTNKKAAVAVAESGDGETVWCVSNRNGTLITRRGGKVIILGNCPPVSCMIEARPTKSLALWLQHCGRVLRSYPLKRDAIILDHAGNTLRHQPPDWPRDWTLASKPKADKSSSSSSSSDVHQCQDCFFVYEGSGACPECGFVDKGGLEHREGTLGEVLPQFICAACKADMPGAAAGDPCDVCRRGYAKRIYRIKKLSKNRIIAAWQMEAAEKGYAPAWLFHKIERLKANGWQQA